MTLFAGAYARNAGDVVPDALCDAVTRALSRHPNEVTRQFRDERCFLVKADIGAFGEEAVRIDERAASFMVGEPLLDHNDSARRSRTDDLGEIHDALLRNNSDPLIRARGIFCLAHYQSQPHRLLLVSDKLGVRPLYYWLGERFVIFGTAIRMLEAVSMVPKIMDVLGVTEIATLGYALAERTAMASVAVLESSEVLEVDGQASSRRQYWRWDDIEPSDSSLDELADEAHRQFTTGVALRNGEDTTTAAFLSGGLDSRSVVMALRAKGVRVHSFNFSVPGLQDQAFGAEFARQVGTIHTERPNVPGRAVSAATMAEAWNGSPHRTAQPAERPGIVWSGDGGSVSLGHVYVNKVTVDLVREGKAEAAIELMTNFWGAEVLPRLMRSEAFEAVVGTPDTGLLQELRKLHCSDPGRSLHLVLMHNDQRRHLEDHFESIDLHRLEYQSPFFDSYFVASVLRVPLDECLGHRFYMRWLRRFPAVALSVPWQAYPGHEPCPLPIPSGLIYQWGAAASRKVRNARRRKLFQQARQMLRSPDFPDALLKRSYLRVAAWLYGLGLRDLSYVIRQAQIYCDYWSKYGGRYDLSRLVAPDRQKAGDALPVEEE